MKVLVYLNPDIEVYSKEKHSSHRDYQKLDI